MRALKYDNALALRYIGAVAAAGQQIGITLGRPTRRPRSNKPRRAPRPDIVTIEQAKRWLAWLGKALMVACVIAAVWAASQWFIHYLRHSPAFAVETIDLRGNQRLSRDEVLRAAGIQMGDNAFAHDSDIVQERLARHRWVASAEVHRALPDRYAITIHEHQPVAILALDQLYLVSKEGAVFKQLNLGDPVDMPVITGVETERFEKDKQYRASTLLRVLALLEDYRGAGLWKREPISEVHVMDDDELALYVGKDVTYVKLGGGPYRVKLKKLRDIFDRLDTKYLRAAYVYLDNVRRSDRAVVRLR